MKYYYTKSTTIVDPEGKTVEWSMLKPDMPVTYTYVKDGDRMVVSKITVQKPVAEITKERFLLPRFGAHLEKLKKTLMNGLGFEVIRGLPVANYSQEFRREREGGWRRLEHLGDQVVGD